jgi:uncharacterized protein
MEQQVESAQAYAAVLERIATALERIAPPLERLAPAAAVPHDPEAKAYHYDGAELVAVPHFTPLELEALIGIEAQKAALLENTRRHAQGFAAHDILLWGARGSGKSALVKAAVAQVQAQGLPLALIEVTGKGLAQLPKLFAQLARTPRTYILFLDDLGFEAGSQDALHLRSLLQGGLMERPVQCRIYATSNRRHIVPRQGFGEEEVLAADNREDSFALADRFGLSLGFAACTQETYLAMVTHYAATLGFPYTERAALLWAMQRGSRSGRVAYSFALQALGDYAQAQHKGAP